MDDADADAEAKALVHDGKRNDATMKETEEVEDQRTKERNDGEVVRWGMFLPRMVVRVLLVEADHSTRQIITALLRKCGYSVIAVSDGLKAWETLKSKSTDLDLVLTELELPSISGFALLTLIMEHDTCKNIPVIMMSSHDSVSIVFKCMLKGAADFLIKPLRWNELRNLWQHVWRRHAISRPLQNTTFPQEQLEAASQDNSTSNQSNGPVASLQQNNECVENLIEAQSTCTSPFLLTETAYMENMQDASQLKSSLNLINTDVNEESSKFESELAKHNDDTGMRSVAFISSSRANCNSNTKIHECSDAVGKSSRAIDLIATFENLEEPENDKCSLNSGNKSKFDFDSKLELSLSRDFSDSSCKQPSKVTQERQILNHSNTSAFTRYSGSKLVQLATPSAVSAKVNNIDWNSQESHKSLGKNDSSCQYGGTNKKENMTTRVIGGQFGPNLSSSQDGLFPATESTSESKGHGNTFTSVLYAQSGVNPIWNPKRACEKDSSPFLTSTSSQSNPEIHNSEQCHHHMSEEAAYTPLNQNVHDKSNLDDAWPDSSATGQSDGNGLCHDGANRINSSAHESIGSASEGNATSTLVAKNNTENSSDNGCHNYDGFRGTNSHQSSQREAALTKFRLKRKERCFVKKVRYQRRKTLAEQRPRVKGQFVRQAQLDHPVADGGGDS